MKTRFLIYFLFLGSAQIVAQKDTTITVDEIRNMSMGELLRTKVSDGAVYAHSKAMPFINIRVIYKKEVKAKKYITVADIIDDASNWLENDVEGFNEYFKMRGGKKKHPVMLLIDGKKVTNYSDNEPTGTNQVQINYINQIEIIYGSFLLTNSSAPMSCIVNIRMKD